MFLTLPAINNECKISVGLHVFKLYAVWFLQCMLCVHISSLEAFIRLSISVLAATAERNSLR